MNNPTCPTCGNPLTKNGKYKGRQKWRCLTCKPVNSAKSTRTYEVKKKGDRAWEDKRRAQKREWKRRHGAAKKQGKE